jgi:hypothetical protein
MTSGAAEQRNLYKGNPPRAWARLRLLTDGGLAQDFDLFADTGDPFAIVISEANILQFRSRAAPDVRTNFGNLKGGWIRLQIPDIGFDQRLVGYGNDSVVAAAQASSTDFGGILGLSLLRMMRFGGDADSFWIRPRI